MTYGIGTPFSGTDSVRVPYGAAQFPRFAPQTNQQMTDFQSRLKALGLDDSSISDIMKAKQSFHSDVDAGKSEIKSGVVKSILGQAGGAEAISSGASTIGGAAASGGALGALAAL